jgi:hypothetical protein
MATWNEILTEIQKAPAQTDPTAPSPFDSVRRKYLRQLADRVGHPVIVYATAFLDPAKSRGDVSIHMGDKEGFLEVTRDLPSGSLDVILHSPGGTAEAAETIVDLLRAKFDPVRFLIPIAAKSAATMLAMAGDEIVGDRTTELGPIDPQFRIVRPDRVVMAPAQAIKMQFEKAEEEIRRDATKLAAWMPILSQYGPSLLVECDQQIALSRRLVSEWLRQYMFAGDADADAKADGIASYLADWANFASHSRAVGLDKLEARGAVVSRFSDDAGFEDAVWSAWHAISLSLENTGCVKLFENSDGRTKVHQQQLILAAAGPASPQQMQAPLLPRRDRRALERQQRKKIR